MFSSNCDLRLDNLDHQELTLNNSRLIHSKTEVDEREFSKNIVNHTIRSHPSE